MGRSRRRWVDNIGCDAPDFDLREYGPADGMKKDAFRGLGLWRPVWPVN